MTNDTIESREQSVGSRLEKATEVFQDVVSGVVQHGSVIVQPAWGEHELDAVFEGIYDGPVNPDPDEAADFKWMTIKELNKDIVKNPQIYTPWFKIILKKLNSL